MPAAAPNLHFPAPFMPFSGIFYTMAIDMHIYICDNKEKGIIIRGQPAQGAVSIQRPANG